MLGYLAGLLLPVLHLSYANQNAAYHLRMASFQNKLMKEPVIVQANVKDKIRIDDKYDYTANLTIGLAEHGDFYLVIDFTNLTEEHMKNLAKLSVLPRRISIQSDVIDTENYNITHIVVTRFTADNSLAMKWECLSDDPSLYEGLTIK